MKRHKGGYTVVEVMLFLIISGAMFTIAFFGTRGQQDKVAFRQSLNDIELKIKEIFNNVDNGYSGNTGEYTCTAKSPAYNVIISNTPNEAGANNDCLFLGKQFSFGSTNMTTETILGARNKDTNTASGLSETYNLKYSINYTHAAPNPVRLRAIRASNSSGDSDMRAIRQYDDGSGWTTISAAIPLCFELGDNLKGTIYIYQKEIAVKYEDSGGVTCK